MVFGREYYEIDKYMKDIAHQPQCSLFCVSVFGQFSSLLRKESDLD